MAQSQEAQGTGGDLSGPRTAQGEWLGPPECSVHPPAGRGSRRLAGSCWGCPARPGRGHLVGHGLQLPLALSELPPQCLVLRVGLLRLGFLEIHLSS